MIIAVAAVIVVDRFVRRIRPNEAKDEGSVRPNDYSIDSPAGEAAAAGEDPGVTTVVEASAVVDRAVSPHMRCWWFIL